MIYAKYSRADQKKTSLDVECIRRALNTDLVFLDKCMSNDSDKILENKGKEKIIKK